MTMFEIVSGFKDNQILNVNSWYFQKFILGVVHKPGS